MKHTAKKPGSSLAPAELTTGSLPAELVQDVGRRVEIAALTFAAVWTVVAVMSNATVRAVGHDPTLHHAWDLFGNELTAAVIVLSLGLAYWASRLPNRPGLVLNVGLGFQLVNAAAIALVSQWNPAMLGRGISWICVPILVYPAIVPARPIAILAVSLVSATFDPLVYALAVRGGVTSPQPTFMLVWAFLPTYICAFLAVIPAQIVRRLGRQIKEAREVGSYRLEERIGAGGMGEVFRATHRLLARPAAVKLIAPGQLGGAAQSLLLERFRREASAAASLRSPHTIELYDFGLAANGGLYYAMELLDGLDLQVLVDEFGPQQPARVVRILRQACLSLGEAHRRGLVHRDIKPSNLMVCRMGTQLDFLKVLDFGLVKMDAPADTKLTAPEVTAGTPAYMPPEAIDGVATFDHRADLYALGCVAYWLLCGRPVFQGTSPLAVLMKHGRDAPPPMLGSIVPVPDDLERLVLQCLEKDPAHRPDDALALERSLARCDLADAWTDEDAAAWWASYWPERSEAPGPTVD